MFDICCQETTVKNEEYYLCKGASNHPQKRIAIRESQVNTNIEQSL